MKNRKLAIVAFLLCACMVIGIGYAALTSVLTVTGGLHAEARQHLAVYFTAAEVDSETENNMCDAATLATIGNSLSVNMETKYFTNVGQKAVAKFTIKSLETVANMTHASIDSVTPVLATAGTANFDAGDYYRVTYRFEEADNTALGDTEHAVGIADDGQSVTDLPPMHEVYLIVEVELLKSITDDANYAANFTITFTAEGFTHND